MVTWTADVLLKATDGRLRSPLKRSFEGIVTDSRQPNLTGCLFIPLVGEQFDAHDFILKVVEKKPSCILVHQWKEEWDSLVDQVTFIQVKDTLVALQKIAELWRQQVPAQILAVTGSNGKTTTKDFLLQILSTQGQTTASQGSFNNHWGVPLSMCKLDKNDQYGVIEMGMNHVGEIKGLCEMACPDVVAVTNIGRAHLGNFKNIEEIADAKKEIYQAAPSQARLVFNQDNPLTLAMAQEFKERSQLFFSTQNSSSDVYLRGALKSEGGYEITGHIGKVSGEATVSFWGLHNVENLACACGMALAAGMTPEKIWKGMSQCQTGWGRNQWLELESGGQLIFDGYNANPDSFSAFVNNLGDVLPKFKFRVGIFGEMLEMGALAHKVHFELGEQISKLPLDQTFFIGRSSLSFKEGWDQAGGGNNLVILDSYKDFLAFKPPVVLDAKSIVAVKGSRGQKLENVVKFLSPKDF